MNNPKHRQEWIYDLLKSEPNLSYSDCFGKFSVEFGKSERTFDSDWKKAKAKHDVYQKTINEARLNESIKIEKEAVKKDILSKHEAEEILTKIAKGLATKTPDGKINAPNSRDRISAIGKLAELNGWNAPTEINSNWEMPTVIIYEDK